MTPWLTDPDLYGDMRLYPDMPLKCPDCGSDNGLAFALLERALAWREANRELLSDGEPA